MTKSYNEASENADLPGRLIGLVGDTGKKVCIPGLARWACDIILTLMIP